MGVSDLRGPMTPDEREIEQCRLIAVYLSELWCPQPPMLGPEPASRATLDGYKYRWVRHLDLAHLRSLPYNEVIDAIRAA